jgi:hypothetical protein
MGRYLIGTFCQKLVSTLDKDWRNKDFRLVINLGSAVLPTVSCQWGLSEKSWFCNDIELPFYNELIGVLSGIPHGINIVTIEYNRGRVESVLGGRSYLAYSIYFYMDSVNKVGIERLDSYLSTLRRVLRRQGYGEGLVTIYEEDGCVYLKGVSGKTHYSGQIKGISSNSQKTYGVCSLPGVAEAVNLAIDGLSEYYSDPSIGISKVVFTLDAPKHTHCVICRHANKNGAYELLLAYA